MATAWYGSHFPPVDDDGELVDVFRMAPTSAPESECKVSSPTNVTNLSRSYCQKMVTLHSLSNGCDSGYVSSPSSVHSFTFSNDEDKTISATSSHMGTTPPITIPYTCTDPSSRHHPLPTSSHQPSQDGSPGLHYGSLPVGRGRSSSCPEKLCPSVLTRPCVPMPTHGHTWSLPVTAPNGQPQLMKEHRGQSFGYQRRVLVLALPDLVVDRERCASSPCTSPLASHSRLRQRAFSCEVTLTEELGRTLRWIADSFPVAEPNPDESDIEEVPSMWRRVRDSFRRSFNTTLSSSWPA